MDKKPFHSDLDCVVRIGGEAGEGVISCGEIFAQAAARTKYHVFTYITYPAEIRGGFSMVQIRIRDWTIYSMGNEIDYLVCFNQEAYDRAASSLRKGGLLIYDPDAVTVPPGSASRPPSDPPDQDSPGKNRRGPGQERRRPGRPGAAFDIQRETLEALVRRRFGKKAGVSSKRTSRPFMLATRPARRPAGNGDSVGDRG